jgi:hypothetical protein
VHNKVLRSREIVSICFTKGVNSQSLPVVLAAGEVLVEDSLGAVGVSLQSLLAYVLKFSITLVKLTSWASMEVPDM